MPPNILYYAIPFFVLLLSLEAWLSFREQKEIYEVKDTFSSLALGIGNLISGILSKAVVFGAFTLAYKYRIFNLDGSSVWVWVLGFFADDFSYYWFHRISHQVNWFWASHVVHHSSQRYNLAAALRQTWTGNITGSFLFWVWMPLVGFHPVMVLTFQSISLIYQFWIHTELINRLPKAVEYVFNTPSHHRVHHGTELKYLDRNHGGIFIFWDRIFGTFTPEIERPHYGLTENMGTFNPLVVAFKTWRQLLQKAAHAPNLRTALLYFVKPPNWSKDGSSKTTRDRIRDHNAKHPDQRISYAR